MSDALDPRSRSAYPNTKPKPMGKTKQVHDWPAIEHAYMLSPIEGFSEFLKAANLPISLRSRKEAKGLPERKAELRKQIIATFKKNVDPLEQTLALIEEARRRGITKFTKFLESADILQYTSTLLLAANQTLLVQQATETHEAWAKRIMSVPGQMNLLSPQSLFLLANTLEKAQKMMQTVVEMDSTEFELKVKKAASIAEGTPEFRVTVVNPEALPEPGTITPLKKTEEKAG